MAIYPGAVFKPTPFGGKVPRNRQGRGMLHVAVSSRVSYPPESGTTWHFYIAKAAPNGATDGSGGPAYCEQYVDTEYRAYGGAEGNDDQIIVETAGGLGSSAVLNAERWTRAQELRIADLMRWEAAQPGGAPLELLPDAKPGRRGWGPHRLGIKHSRGLVPGWWFPGCELWSSSIGKECPGDAKIAQIPGIIEMARTGQTEDDMPLTNEDAQRVAEAVWGSTIKAREGIGPAQARDWLTHAAVYSTRGAAAVSQALTASLAGRKELTAEEIEAAVEKALLDAGEALRAASAKPDA